VGVLSDNMQHLRQPELNDSCDQWVQLFNVSHFHKRVLSTEPHREHLKLRRRLNCNFCMADHCHINAQRAVIHVDFSPVQLQSVLQYFEWNSDMYLL